MQFSMFKVVNVLYLLILTSHNNQKIAQGTTLEKLRLQSINKICHRFFLIFQPIGQTFVQQLDKSIPLRGGGFSIDVKRPIRDQPIRKYFFALTDNKTNINLHKARYFFTKGFQLQVQVNYLTESNNSSKSER